MQSLKNTLMPNSTRERFDINRVDVQGKIYKIWSREDGNIYARMQLDDPHMSEGVRHNPRITLALLEGAVDGQDVSIRSGDHVRVGGYLRDLTLPETLAEFLNRAKRPELLEQVDQLRMRSGLKVSRCLTCVIPQMHDPLDEGQDGFLDAGTSANRVRIEGVVARIWRYAHHSYARIAVYDRFSSTSDDLRPGILPRRQAHYVTLQFTDGRVDGRQVVVGARQRIRVAGRLIYRIYWEDLRGFLLQTKDADIIT